jgi:hypothetical protein
MILIHENLHPTTETKDEGRMGVLDTAVETKDKEQC